MKTIKLEIGNRVKEFYNVNDNESVVITTINKEEKEISKKVVDLNKNETEC